jgi:site-specific DNA recombinase
MKKAVLYARVSSDLQKKERTIESQVVELKKQVAAAGDVLVKEYIDDGYSGARLDRPALDELRSDLKSALFDTIYFLNTDRIAREVTYQMIIIAEILKHKKQIIINGVDYIHNPENNFTLTVLGAVAELERAKIIERATRGKQLRLAQGFLLGLGSNIYGYDYVRKMPSSPPAFVINPKEAAPAENFLTWSVVVRPLKGETPTIDLVVGYHKANTSPILRTFLSKIDDLTTRISSKARDLRT